MSNFIYNSYSVENTGVVQFYRTEEQRLADAGQVSRGVKHARQPLLTYVIAGAAALVLILANWFESSD